MGNLHGVDFDAFVLLDTDMIVVGDIRPFVSMTHLVAKPVDLSNPPLATLEEIAVMAGMKALPSAVSVGASDDMTLAGNFNGGFYSIPKHLCRQLDAAWRQWAMWLIDHGEPLRKVGKEIHADQVSMWLAVHMAGVLYQVAASNVNYYVHFDADHHYLDATRDIVLLHYHDVSLNVVGKLEPPAALDDRARRAVEQANGQIGRGFESTLFWNLRYSRFPERGSGVGSRGRKFVVQARAASRAGRRGIGKCAGCRMGRSGSGQVAQAEELSRARYVRTRDRDRERRASRLGVSACRLQPLSRANVMQ